MVVRQRLQLSASMVRVVADIQDPSQFQDIEPPEKYVKLVFFDPALDLGPHPDYWELKESLPPEQQPVTRHMTLRKVDLERGSVWIDVATHGQVGFAGPWAMQAQPGDTIVAVGPGGKWVPDPQASWSLFLGDDAAIPAIAANLETLPDDAQGVVLLEVEGPEDQMDLPVPSGMTLRWCHRRDQAPGTHALVEAAEAVEWPTSTEGVQAFAHGEREAMKLLRPIIFGGSTGSTDPQGRGLTKEQVSISGYWARGRTEEVFQAEKRTPIGQV
nr:siderophore-interacting protein [Kocuria sp. JC486]